MVTVNSLSIKEQMVDLQLILIAVEQPIKVKPPKPAFKLHAVEELFIFIAQNITISLYLIESAVSMVELRMIVAIIKMFKD